MDTFWPYDAILILLRYLCKWAESSELFRRSFGVYANELSVLGSQSLLSWATIIIHKLSPQLNESLAGLRPTPSAGKLRAATWSGRHGNQCKWKQQHTPPARCCCNLAAVSSTAVHNKVFYSRLGAKIIVSSLPAAERLRGIVLHGECMIWYVFTPAADDSSHGSQQWAKLTGTREKNKKTTTTPPPQKKETLCDIYL